MYIYIPLSLSLCVLRRLPLLLPPPFSVLCLGLHAKERAAPQHAEIYTYLYLSIYLSIYSLPEAPFVPFSSAVSRASCEGARGTSALRWQTWSATESGCSANSPRSSYESRRWAESENDCIIYM